jgi:hypothetical protein
MSLVYHKFSRMTGIDPSFEHLKALTLAACHSQAKYSDYSDEKIITAFTTATDMIFAAEATSSPLFVVPLAIVLMNMNTITLTFTCQLAKVVSLSSFSLKKPLTISNRKSMIPFSVRLTVSAGLLHRLPTTSLNH